MNPWVRVIAGAELDDNDRVIEIGSTLTDARLYIYAGETRRLIGLLKKAVGAL